MRNPTILIKSGWQDINIGDIGHTPGLLALLKAHAPGVIPIFWPYDLSDAVEEMLLRHFPGLEIVHGSITNGRADNPDLAEACQRAQLLIHGPGPCLMGAGDLRAWHEMTGKPYGIYGITITEFDELDHAVVSRAAFAYGRETLSAQALASAGFPSTRTGFVPDACVACTIADDARALPWMKGAGLEEGRFLVAIPRNRRTPYHWSKASIEWTQEQIRAVEEENHLHREEDFSKLRAIITRWVRETHLPVLLAPEMLDALSLLGPHLFALLPDDVRPYVVLRDKWWLTDEASSIFARAAAMISLDCHSPLLAMARDVPALYLCQPQDAPKARMYEDFGLQEWLLPIESTCPDKAADQLLSLYRNRQQAVSYIQQAKANISRIHAQTISEILEFFLEASPV